uniref:30S ribosomal protein S18 n=1 Tax=Porphyridium purpureum TaxID=35688 RepID=W0RYX2_PORPP|nr:chloroplast 30S ribosomal protein S18 [Porphyridium purpureum]ATJ02864.1 30S ribosomal protein S18 [Porphyridium purpureum]BAO23637.1 chloroplast 30S ribosomal protein S18 [Porphyridium purpureum]
MVQKNRKIELKNNETLNYKDIDILRRFINDQGKILPRKLTGLTMKEQKKVATSIKQARMLAILPFTNQEI